MSVERDKIYPDCPTLIKTVEVGGLTKSQLLQKLQQHSILMNELGERLFADDKFTFSDTIYSVRAVELKVRDLGFPEGATIPQLFEKANKVGLKLCPLELGPHLRLEYLDQPEGHSGKPFWRHRAPYGSVTIASEILSEDVDFPKGFYLRRIEGVLWLRGYIADDLHVLGPDDHFVFCQNENVK
ncbi:helicase [Bacillus salipaludis]|uniref:Helicase n=1 Tax=Bacillus salipaludis TaxID=2547811 RepID=A0A4R5VJ91_9BACI|nr:helicase [Bacillus salipaludis]MDQ6597945.1 helicase [Bacillus salipaludis]TDK54169.1 helicase [Bacillus salipaludis]